MRQLTLAVALFVVVAAVPAHAADPIAEARRLYNLGDYDGAERMANEALRVRNLANSAHLVLGRIQLERFRRSLDPVDLSHARESLRAVDTANLDARERVELTIGFGEALFLEDRFGAAAELFESVLDSSRTLGAAAHERLLDWWASALDRLAQGRPREVRTVIFERVLRRMGEEIAVDPGSTPAAYWLAAAARGAGDLDRAWNAAIGSWVRAALARDRGAALRADLDRLVTTAIIPERAGRLPARDQKQAAAAMTSEWEAVKKEWSRD
jgi:tetratricopeptide (TPR) repeat protein